MKKSNTWQLAVIALVVLVALFAALDIDHPQWFKDLLIWQPMGLRSASLQAGLDLQSGTDLLLTADPAPGEELDPAAMGQALEIVRQRAQGMSSTDVVVWLQDERHIRVQMPTVQSISWVTRTIQSTALVEFIDAGPVPLSAGALIETTLGGPRLEEPEVTTSTTISPITPITSTTPSTDTLTPETPANPVYETVLSNPDLGWIAIYRNEDEQAQTAFGSYINTYSIHFTPVVTASDRFVAYTATHAGQYLCLALDKEVLHCAALPDEALEGTVSIPQIALTQEMAESIAVLFGYVPYGALPVPLQLENTTTVEPALGQTAVQQSSLAAWIGLAAVLLFLTVHYRLPGLLTAVSLLVFGLLALALCKLIPIALILPSVVGLAATSLLALGEHLVIVEALREELRRGRSLAKAVANCLALTSSSISRTHVLLLLIGAAAWYTGARFSVSSIEWLGLAWTAGTLVSFFVTGFVTPAFLRLALGRGREWPAERNWLMGI